MKPHIKTQDWRAIVRLTGGEELVLYVGPTEPQVRLHYLESYYESLTDEERPLVSQVLLQTWNGTHTSGRWDITDTLPLPPVRARQNYWYHPVSEEAPQEQAALEDAPGE